MTGAKRKPVGEAELVRMLANEYWLPVEDVEAARAILKLRPNDFTVLFTHLVRFAHLFGMNVKDTAEFVAANTSGIQPWMPERTHTPDEYARVRKAVPDGDWVAAILELLDQLEERSKT